MEIECGEWDGAISVVASQPGMVDKIRLVTGATSGLAQVTAFSLADQGAQVIVAGRNRRRAKETVQRIQASQHSFYTRAGASLGWKRRDRECLAPWTCGD